MQGKWMMGCSTEFMEPVHTDTDDKRGDKRYQEVKKKGKSSVRCLCDRCGYEDDRAEK